MYKSIMRKICQEVLKQQGDSTFIPEDVFETPRRKNESHVEEYINSLHQLKQKVHIDKNTPQNVQKTPRNAPEENLEF